MLTVFSKFIYKMKTTQEGIVNVVANVKTRSKDFLQLISCINKYLNLQFCCIMVSYWDAFFMHLFRDNESNEYPFRHIYLIGDLIINLHVDSIYRNLFCCC
jgi:hypothetical protein